MRLRIIFKNSDLLPHEVKGNSIHAYVILRIDFDPSDSLKEKLRNHIGHEIGPIAKPESITFLNLRLINDQFNISIKQYNYYKCPD